MSTSVPTLPKLPGIGVGNSQLPEFADIQQIATDLGNADPNGALSIAQNGGIVSSPVSDAGNSTSTTGTTAPASTSSATSSGVLGSVYSFLTGSVESVIFVIIGLLLIGAGLYAFKTTQTIIQTGGKIAKTAAEVTA